MNGSRIATERWAALNYQDLIVLVAELDGPDHETLVDNHTGVQKKALRGRVLPAEHPVHRALIGTQVQYRRNPVSYDPDPEITVLTDSDFPGRTWDTSDARPRAASGLRHP